MSYLIMLRECTCVLDNDTFLVRNTHQNNFEVLLRSYLIPSISHKPYLLFSCISLQPDKVIPLNLDTTRASNPPVITVAVSPVKTILSENSTPFGEIRNTVARTTSKPDCLTPPIPWAKVSQRSKSCADNYSNTFEKDLSDAIAVTLRERGGDRDRGKEGRKDMQKGPLSLQLGHDKDLDVDAEQSWYALGHTMDRSRFSIREDGAKPSLRDTENENDSSESDVVGSDDVVRGDDDYNTNHRSHGSLFLDKSTSHTRFHDGCGKHKSVALGGNTWSTSTSMKKNVSDKEKEKEKDAQQAALLSSDGASSYSDNSLEGLKIASNGSSKIFQSVSCLSFDGSTESHRINSGGGGGGSGVALLGNGSTADQKSVTNSSAPPPADGIPIKMTQVPSRTNRTAGSNKAPAPAPGNSTASESTNRHSNTAEKQVKHNESHVKGQVKVLPQETSSTGCVIN
jgi:hypothetical protein